MFAREVNACSWLFCLALVLVHFNFAITLNMVLSDTLASYVWQKIVVDCCFLVYIFFDLLINIFGCNLTNLTMSSIHLSQLWAGRDSCCSWCLIFYIGWLSLFLRFVCQLLRSMYNNLKQHPRYLCFKVIDLLETCIVHFPC